MPLYPHAVDLIRANFEQLAQGQRVRPIAIGVLTNVQLTEINASRQNRAHPLPPIIAEVIFFGKHMYESRVIRDGYTIDDVLDQITSAMSSAALFVPTSKAAAIQNHVSRLDRYGSTVQDMAVFECTARHPRPELFSVMPKGDKAPNAPAEMTKGRR